MITHDGTRTSELLREHPAMDMRRNMNTMLRGIIMENGVHHKDKNQSGQTLVDIALLGGYPNIQGAAIACSKSNPGNGESWTPQVGDCVLVAFINGNWTEPVVVSWLPLMDDGKDTYEEKEHNLGEYNNQGGGSNVQSLSSDVPENGLRYHRRVNETDFQIDADGNQIVTIAGYEDRHVLGYRTTKIEEDETLEVQGNGTVIIHGNITVHVYGTATVNVDGDTTVTTPNATVNASGKMVFNTPLSQFTGDVEVAGGIKSTGSYGTTGGKIVTPGNIESTGGDVKDKVRTIAADRGIYNGHTHPENGTGGGTTSAPTQQE